MIGLKKTSGLILIVVLCVFLVAFILPAEFKVVRSITINAPAEKIYPQLASLRNWQNWGVWFKRDPNIILEYSGTDGEVGMVSTWSSATEGHGEMSVIALEENKRLIYSLSFPDMGMTSTGELILTTSEVGTEVTWMDYGEVGYNPVDRYVALFMDDIVGQDFETGLENLKTISENP